MNSNNDELVSIIIPVYNVEKYIRACLESVAKQDYKNLEIIIIDDCGSDDSINITKQFINVENLKNVKIIRHTKNKGLSEARNTGLQVANGKYIYFLDSDDEISPNAISSLMNTAKVTKAQMVCGNVKLVGARSVHIHDIRLRIAQNGDILAHLANNDYSVSAWGKLYLKDFLDSNNIKFEPGILHEDMLFQAIVAIKATKIAGAKDSIYYYKIRSSSITRSIISSKRIKDLYFIISQLLQTRNNYKYQNDLDRYIGKIIFLTQCLSMISELSSLERQELFVNLKSIKIKSSLFHNITRNMNYSLFSFIFKAPYIVYKDLIGRI